MDKIFLFILLSNFFVFAQKSDDSWKLYDESSIARIDITIDSSAIAWLYSHINEDSFFVCKVKFKNAFLDEIIDSVGFRLRGNTSRQAFKKSFKLSFDRFIKGREFHGVDNLNLNGEHNDPSIIRSKLSWDVFNRAGVISSRAAHAKIYINGEYFGLYISVEEIDKEFLKRNFKNHSGNLWKCLWPADLVFLGTDPNIYKFEGWNRPPYELKTNTDENDFTELAKFISVLNNTSPSLFQSRIELVLDIASVLKYFALNTLLGSWDEYRFLRNNYFLYFNPSSEKMELIPFDYDNTLGIDFFDVDWANINPYSWQNIELLQGQTTKGRPLSDKLLAVPEYRNLFTHFLLFYTDNLVNLQYLEPKIDSIKNLITPAIISDTYRTLDYGFTIDDFFNSYSSSNYSKLHVKNGLKEFLNIRHNSIGNQTNFIDSPPLVYSLNFSPENPSAFDSIVVSVSAFSNIGLKNVEIILKQNNSTISLPMNYSPVAETKKVELSDRWIGVIPPLGYNASAQFNIKVEDTKSNSLVFPRAVSIPIQTPKISDRKILINELLAKNNNTNTDQSGEFDDWVELFNQSTDTIKLSGKFLTDNFDNLTKWQFPGDSIFILPGEYKLIWCDSDTLQPGLHTNFKLDAAGERIALVSEDNISIIDSISFAKQFADISFGRFPNASDDWKFLQPSPASSNTVTDVVNETLLPVDFDLRVYPNPFNPSTNIRYSLAKKSVVKILIYNSMGQEIFKLNRGIQDAGTYNYFWTGLNSNGIKLSSGVYFIQLETELFAKTIKVLLLK